MDDIKLHSVALECTNRIALMTPAIPKFGLLQSQHAACF